MPVTASTLVHRAPARAWTRGSPNRKAGAPPAILGEGGPRDPLKGWTRKDAALADTFSIEQCGVDCTGPGLQLVEMDQPPQAAQVVRVVDHGLDPQRPPVFQILLDAGVPSFPSPVRRARGTVFPARLRSSEWGRRRLHR